MGAIEVVVRPTTSRARINGANIDWDVATRIGPVHARNQDAYCTAPPVFVVADGMGGHSAGDLASRAAIEALSPLIDREPVTGVMLDACLADARSRIGRISVDDQRPPGTTLSGVIVTELDDAPFWMVVNIGDSRTYRLNSGASAR
jgi:protein phosphatase